MLGDDTRHEALLTGVTAEDVGKAGREHYPEAEVTQSPHGMLSARPGSEVGTGDENRGALECGLIEDELGILTPAGEQRVFKSGLGHSLEEHSGNDLVSVDRRSLQRRGDTGVRGESVHLRPPIPG